LGHRIRGDGHSSSIDRWGNICIAIGVLLGDAKQSEQRIGVFPFVEGWDSSGNDIEVYLPSNLWLLEMCNVIGL
jgi:hypothetical protein